MKIKAVIFDVEGVILNTEKFHEKAWMKLFSLENIEVTKSELRKLYGLPRLEALEKVLSKEDRFYPLEEKMSLTEKKNSIYKKLLEELNETDILPGVKSIIHELKNMGIFICCESSSQNAELMLKKSGLLSFFDACVFGTEIKNTKPNPEIFLLTAKKLGVEPSSCVAVVDDEKSIIAATKASMYTVAIGKAARTYLAPYNLRSLTDVKSVVLQIENEE